MHQFDLPATKKVTYACFVCDYRPLKPEQYRVRLVVGGDGLDYSEDAGAPAASMLETKISLNSVISDAHNKKVHNFSPWILKIFSSPLPCLNLNT